MTITPGDGGGGAGSGGGGGTPPPNTGICSPTPSDLAGVPQNYLDRLKALEDKVAEILAGNVTANQLSDLATQVGWVGGITFMGVDGWTQTEAGTLIPPPGMSLSSLGFNYQDVGGVQQIVLDENGVALFGMGINGLFGSLVDTWNAGAGSTLDYAIYDLVGGISSSRNVSISTGARSVTFTCTNGGIWLAMGTCTHYGDNPQGASITSTSGQIAGGTWQTTLGGGTDFVYGIQMHGLFSLSAGNALTLSIPGVAAVGAKNMYAIRLSS